MTTRASRFAFAALLAGLALGQCTKQGRHAPTAAPLDAGRPLPRVLDAAAPDAAPREEAACGADGDCGWDDPCIPRRCQPGRPPPVGCDKSSRPLGLCRCIDRRCTLQPDAPPPASEACDADRDCQPDPGTALCVRGGRALGPID